MSEFNLIHLSSTIKCVKDECLDDISDALHALQSFPLITVKLLRTEDTVNRIARAYNLRHLLFKYYFVNGVTPQR